MILYHGSNTSVREVDLSKCRPFKDFGQGFYLTDILPQAERMAQRVCRWSNGEPIVSVFEFDIDSARDAGLDIRIFNCPSPEWALFVMANRNEGIPQPAHTHDIVIGPVADDRMARQFALYDNDAIDLETVVRGITYKDLTSQYFFHTPRALSFLKPL